MRRPRDQADPFAQVRLGDERQIQAWQRIRGHRGGSVRRMQPRAAVGAASATEAPDPAPAAHTGAGQQGTEETMELGALVLFTGRLEGTAAFSCALGAERQPERAVVGEDVGEAIVRVRNLHREKGGGVEFHPDPSWTGPARPSRLTVVEETE